MKYSEVKYLEMFLKFACQFDNDTLEDTQELIKQGIIPADAPLGEMLIFTSFYGNYGVEEFRDSYGEENMDHERLVAELETLARYGISFSSPAFMVQPMTERNVLDYFKQAIKNAKQVLPEYAEGIDLDPDVVRFCRTNSLEHFVLEFSLEGRVERRGGIKDTGKIVTEPRAYLDYRGDYVAYDQNTDITPVLPFNGWQMAKYISLCIEESDEKRMKGTFETYPESLFEERIDSWGTYRLERVQKKESTQECFDFDE